MTSVTVVGLIAAIFALGIFLRLVLFGAEAAALSVLVIAGLGWLLVRAARSRR